MHLFYQNLEFFLSQYAIRIVDYILLFNLIDRITTQVCFIHFKQEITKECSDAAIWGIAVQQALINF